MPFIRRYVQPVATALVSLALAFLALYLRPTNVGATRTIVKPVEGRFGPAGQPVPGGALESTNSTLDTILLVAFISGLVLIFIGSMGVIWHRSRPRGRHRTTV